LTSGAVTPPVALRAESTFLSIRSGAQGAVYGLRLMKVPTAARRGMAFAQARSTDIQIAPIRARQ